MKIPAKLKDIFSLSKLSQKQKKELLNCLLALLAICSAAALVVSGVNEFLSGIIEKNASAPVISLMERMLPADEYKAIEFDFEEANGVVSFYEAYKENELIGYCASTKAKDYGGEMLAMIALNKENKVVAVEIISMPDGVGTKVKEKSFLNSFILKSGKLASVKNSPKDETQISAISGATESSAAVTECVNRAIAAVSQFEAEKSKEAVK